jgi:hypothetical protein
MKRAYIFLLLCLFFAGCQGRIDFLFMNQTTDDVRIFADGSSYLIPVNHECRAAVPHDQKIRIESKKSTYLFHVPFDRYSVSEDDYISNKNTIRMQIKTPDTMLCLPSPQASGDIAPLIINGVLCAGF